MEQARMDHHDRAEPRQCQQKLGVAVIQMSSEPKVGGLIDDHIYALRNRVERRSNRLKNSRSVAT